MTQNWPLLVQVLRSHELLDRLEVRQWDLVIRQARHAQLMAKIACIAEVRGLARQLPSQVVRHLQSAQTAAEANARQTRWEVNRIQAALDSLDIDIVLLKGAAYLFSKSPAAKGRTFFDVDIMVPKSALQAVEKALHWHGWFSSHHDDYDDRYYRKWMHELPPMKHAQRQSVLDVHHTILPETAKLKPDAQKLFDSAQTVPGYPGLKILAPEDMLLHSAAHLFSDGELEHGLRDLVDLDQLFRQFGRSGESWSRLLDRAKEQDLVRPLEYAIRYCAKLLATPIPDSVICRVEARHKSPPTVMDMMFARALMPDHPSCNTASTTVARFLLYVRSHYLRMPLHLLVPHLLRKALRTKNNQVQADRA